MEVFYALLSVAVIIIIILVIFYVSRISRSRPIGSACNGNAECNAGLVCDNTLRVCRAPIGTQCNNDNDCTNNASCIAGVCALRVTPITAANTPSNAAFTAVPSSGSAPMLQPIIFNYNDSETSCSSSTTCESEPSRSHKWTSSERSQSETPTSHCSPKAYSESSKSLLSDYSPTEYPSSGKSLPSSYSSENDGDYSSSKRTLLTSIDPTWVSSRRTQSLYNVTAVGSVCGEVDKQPLLARQLVEPFSQQSKSGQLSGLFAGQQLKSRESKGMTHNLLDIVEYNEQELMLLKTGEILYDNNKYKNNVPLSRLEVMQEKVFGLSRGSLLLLDTSTLVERVLVWKKVNNAPFNVLHTSSTRDGMHLWLQLKDEGYLLDREGKVVGRVPIPKQQFIRNYGQDANHYIDSYPEQNRVALFVENEELSKTDCAYAIFDHDADGMITCSEADWQLFSDIRLTGKSSYLIAR